MPPGARLGDPTGHPGIVAGPGASSVLIAGKPAARVGDQHVCSMAPPAGPHPTTLFVRGSATVLIDGMPALRVGDLAGCGAPIAAGAVTVVIGG
jgi:uncharacterized Zn-binding protein involved in type VI secretion